MMYSCNDSNDLFHTFLTLICLSAHYMLYRNMSIYCNTLGAIYRYGKIYRHSSSAEKSDIVRDRAPTRLEVCFLSPFMQRRREMDHPVLTKAFLQLRPEAGMLFAPFGCN